MEKIKRCGLYSRNRYVAGMADLHIYLSPLVVRVILTNIIYSPETTTGSEGCECSDCNSNVR